MMGQGTASDLMPQAQAAGQQVIDKWLTTNKVPGY